MDLDPVGFFGFTCPLVRQNRYQTVTPLLPSPIHRFAIGRSTAPAG